MTTNQKPNEFNLAIQGGMLEALGINMYTTLGKCLVEFVANSYDSNAPKVEITIPFDEIESQRLALKDADKKAKAAKKAETESKKASADAPSSTPEASNVTSGMSIAPPDISLYKKTLPGELSIEIRDYGHGMSPADVAQKFLPINRHRRADASGQETNLKSEGGKRAVMGRKGLGKLAGFGIAGQVIVKTKRAGDSFATVFTLDSAKLADAPNLGEIKIPAIYEDDPNTATSGTTITLKGLKPDAVRSSADKIIATLAEAFYGIEPEDFLISLNGAPVAPQVVEFDFVFPEAASTSGSLVSDFVNIPDVGTLPIQYAVRFRKPGQHLPAGKRGARIYCNKRLAAGPSLFKLGTGMHNFHAQDYLECVVVADTLDQLGVDFVNTNRTQLREDNDVVEAILTHVSDLMKAALAAHAKHREAKVDAEIKANEEGSRMNKIIEHLPKRSRVPAGKLLRTIALRHGIESLEFKELAPLVVNSVNAGEVLIRLIELQTDPKTVHQVASELLELADIERSDALKLYRGRKSGIISLRKLIEKGEDLWKQKGIEAELHQLFKSEPWLIKPEYSKYLTSDEDLNKLASKLAKLLNVDAYSALADDAGKRGLDRPDLVFVMSDTASPHVVTIVEFKSPTIPLTAEHLAQLKSYMRRVEAFIESELRQKVTVHGYLIGAMPDPNTKATGELDLLYSIEREWTAQTAWEVLGLEHLLQRAQTIHSDAIDAFERELNDNEADAAVVPPATSAVAPLEPRAIEPK
ncbi:ATP-binding protein [Sphingomonas sp. NCPPB 2930]